MNRYLMVGSLLLAALAGCGRPVVSVPPAGEATASERTADGDAVRPESSSDGFRFPDDRGGKLLAELLPPRASLSAGEGDKTSIPLLLPPPRHLEKPEIPIPTTHAEMPRLPVATGQPLRPRMLLDEWPLADYRADPEPPQRAELLAGVLVRLPSPDVNEPPPLPILAQRVVDRVPLDDPTSEASRLAALAAIPPVRTNPAPFVRINLPDPFEHAHAARLRTPPEETHALPAVTVRRPGN